HQLFLRRKALRTPRIVAEAVGGRFQRFEGFDIGLLVRRIHAAWREWRTDVVSSILCRLLDRGGAAQNDQVGKRYLLDAGLRGLALALERFELVENRRQMGWLVDLPILLRRKANTRTIRTAALV